MKTVRFFKPMRGSPTGSETALVTPKSVFQRVQMQLECVQAQHCLQHSFEPGGRRILSLGHRTFCTMTAGTGLCHGVSECPGYCLHCWVYLRRPGYAGADRANGRRSLPLNLHSPWRCQLLLSACSLGCAGLFCHRGRK